MRKGLNTPSPVGKINQVLKNEQEGYQTNSDRDEDKKSEALMGHELVHKMDDEINSVNPVSLDDFDAYLKAITHVEPQRIKDFDEKYNRKNFLCCEAAFEEYVSLINNLLSMKKELINLPLNKVTLLRAIENKGLRTVGSLKNDLNGSYKYLNQFITALVNKLKNNYSSIISELKQADNVSRKSTARTNDVKSSIDDTIYAKVLIENDTLHRKIDRLEAEMDNLLGLIETYSDAPHELKRRVKNYDYKILNKEGTNND